ncbi:MAG: DUF924 family protein [Pseudomonadota bacterium]
MIMPNDIITFWSAAGPEKWFTKDEAFDGEIAANFGSTFEMAARGELDHWAGSATGALALVLVLDQFPRNLFRDSARAFATDEKALLIADRAIADGHDHTIEGNLRRFLYMPFMHAEDMDHQNRCIALCEADGDTEGVKYARIHAEIIEKFGRFPHRNPVLGRKTTPSEQAFLDAGGFAG